MIFLICLWMVSLCVLSGIAQSYQLVLEWVPEGAKEPREERAPERPEEQKNAPPNHEHQIDHHTRNLITTLNAHICKFSYYIKEL